MLQIRKICEKVAFSFYSAFHILSCPTNEPGVDFFVLRTPKIDENIRNPRIFLRKMATCSCFAGPIDIKIHASMYFMSICPLAHILHLFYIVKITDLMFGMYDVVCNQNGYRNGRQFICRVHW